MFLIVGLGNPGQEYEQTRHNIGFRVINELAKVHSTTTFQRKFNAEFSNLIFNLQKIILFKPLTYINNSGKAVGEVVKFYKIASDDIIVIHDDIDLAVGKIKIKKGGASGSHNGLRSINSLIDPNYWKIKIGVGRPFYKNQVSDYVLDKMDNADKIKTDNIINILTLNLDKICEKNFDYIIQQVNTLEK